MRRKILIPMAVVAVVCAAVIGFMGISVVRMFVGDFNSKQLERAHVVAAAILGDYISNAERTSATVAVNEQLVAAVQNHLAGEEPATLANLAVSIMESTGMDCLTVTDTSGTVLVRGHQPDQFGDSLAFQRNVKSALRGERYATIEEGSVIKLSVLGGSPIYDQGGQMIGVLSLGYRLDQDAFADHIKHLAGTEVAVFLGDTQISTTIADAKGNRSVDTRVPRDVSGGVLEGNDYVGRVTVGGKKLMANYSPLCDVEGSVLGMLFVGLDTSATDANMVQNVWIMVGVVLLLGVLSVFVSGSIASRISRPIIEISDKAKQLAVGDVNIEWNAASHGNDQDEVGVLAMEFREMIQTIRHQAKILSTVADGDYSVSIPIRSGQDVINQAINRLIDRSNQMLSAISASASQVSEGSKQIADGAQSLAQGSSNQASAVQELSASINEIAGITMQNAGIAEEAAVLSGTIKGNVDKGSVQMDQMMQAVQAISDASSQIENVIKVIDDLAFQTNILALNAAVEAARAGKYGKGFAVVAEEVRNLAAKSAQAAKNTSGLIQNSIEKASLGLRIATETESTLKGVTIGINRSAGMIAQIAQSSGEQAGAIAQINIGIDQVAQVVQQNSATAEESAAASEEMSGQADLLAQLTAQFKLKDDGVKRQGAEHPEDARQTASGPPEPKGKVYELDMRKGSIPKRHSRFSVFGPDISLKKR